MPCGLRSFGNRTIMSPHQPVNTHTLSPSHQHRNIPMADRTKSHQPTGDLLDTGRTYLDLKTQLKAVSREASRLRKQLKNLESALLIGMTQQRIATLEIDGRQVKISQRIEDD